MIGRQLTDSEAQQVIEQMQAAAVPAPQMELTPENWDAEFGEDGIVSTPMGDVKMGENQYLKMLREGRNGKFGMIKPTLSDPILIIETSSQAKEGQTTERSSSYVFVKPFAGEDGKRQYLFTSVTVRRDGQEVVISNQEKDLNRISKLLQNGEIVWIKSNDSLHPKTQIEGSIPHSESRSHTLVDQSEAPVLGINSPAVSANKDTTTIPEQQETEQDIPRLKNGQPDYNRMSSAMLAEELSGAMDPDKAIELLSGARDGRNKEIVKMQKSFTGLTDLNKGAEIDAKIEATKKEIARLSEALDLLGFVDKADQTQQEQALPKSKNFTEDIERLFPDGLPNIHARILSDIATGQRFVWADSADRTKRGVASELGFSGNESERKGRFGILGSQSNGAKHVSSYVHDLWEDSNGYAFDMDDAHIRNEVIDALLSTPSRASAMKQLLELAKKGTEDFNTPRDAEDYAAKKAYEEAQIALQKSKSLGTFADKTAKNGDQAESGRDNGSGISTTSDFSNRVPEDSARSLQGGSDRSDIRVFEEAVATSYGEYSDDSQRDRRDSESQRLVAIAKENDLYITKEHFSEFGAKQPGKTGESVVYIDHPNGKVYKIKDPYAKAAIKKNAPEDAIYEHLIHNRLFPETPYKFEGISEHLGDVRIVLSQDYVGSEERPTQAQIEVSLANRGLLRTDKYSYGDHLVSVTDVEGDNALLGVDNQIYFIDPIIGLKKPAREVLDILDGVV